MRRLLLLPILFLFIGAGSRDFVDKDADVVTLAADTTMAIGDQSFTGGAWFKMRSGPGSGAEEELMIFSRGDTVDANKLRMENVSGSFFLQWVLDTSSGGVDVVTDSGGSNFPTGTWLHGSAIYDSGTAYLYGDGNQIHSDTAPAGNLDESAATDVVCIGLGSNGASCGTDRDFDGQIAYVFWSENAMRNTSFGEAMRYESVWNPEVGVSGIPGNTTGPAFFLPLWGDSPEVDISENSNNGTVTGAIASSDGPPVFFGSGLPL